MRILAICGSRNEDGQTARAMAAFLGGCEKGGAETEKLLLPTLNLERCRQCQDNGWGECLTKGNCIIDDDLAVVRTRLKFADALLVATPVYYGEPSESLRACFDRLRRVCMHEAGRSGIIGKPVVGLCVAGGGGGGAPGCGATLEKMLATCGLEVVDMVPVRRQNLKAKLPMLELTGAWLAAGGRAD